MTSITIEPPRYGMTGMSCGSQIDLRCEAGFGYADMQPLDAPEYIARGSLRAERQAVDGAQYVSTTDAMPARMFGGAL